MCLSVKSIAVIGAGPSGLALATALKAERKFDVIKVFERQERPGGVWNYSDETRNTPLIPSTSAFTKEPTDVRNGKPVYYSPMYKTLETNIPKDVMRYSFTPFNKEYENFPTRQQVLSYVQEYASNVNDLIQYNTEVQTVEKVSGQWEVMVTDYNNSKITNQTENFDAIAICTGHYDLPHIPDVPGISEWASKFPGTILHSKYYNDPKDYTGKTVLVIGNSASGLDVSMQAADYATKVYRSINSASRMPYAEDPRITDVPKISSFNASTREIHLTDGSTLSDIDDILYCTGYLYSFPYLRSYTSGPDAVYTSKGSRLYRIYKQIFYIPDPTLVMINMTKFTIPFPLAETQSAVVAGVFSGRLSLPSDEEMRASEQKEVDEKGDSSEFHSFGFPQDVEYYRELQAWIDKSPSGSKYFQPEIWTDERYDLRKNSFDLKRERLENKLSDKLNKSSLKL